jgi:hypothetical protein
LNKQNVFFENVEQEGRTGPAWGVGMSGRGENIRKKCRR